MIKKTGTAPAVAPLLMAAALLALVVALAVSIAAYTHLAISALTFRYPLDYGEGPLLDQVLRLASGENIYRSNFSTPPFTIANYPPLFLLFQVPFVPFFGPAFWYGRMISVLGALATALFLGLTLNRLTGDRVAAGVGGLIFLTFPYVQFWSVLNRVDLLALGLSWAALYVVVSRGEYRWGVWLAAGLLVLAVYTRQSYALAAPLGAFVWLLVERRWRKAVWLALITGGTGLGLFLALNLATQGGFFLNIITANVNPFSWETVHYQFKALIGHTWILILLAGVFLLVGGFRGQMHTWALVMPYLAAAAASGLTIGKDGSHVNYLLELAAALSFAAGAALAWLGRNRWLKGLAAVALVIQVGTLNAWVQEDFAGYITKPVQDEAEIVELFGLVRGTDGIVLADEYMGLIPLAGKRLYYQPFEFKMLAQGGIWDERMFLQSIANQEFSLILWYAPGNWPAIESRWTPDQRKFIQEYYRINAVRHSTRVLKPK